MKSRKQGTGWTSDANRKLNQFLLMGEFTDNTRKRGSRRRSIFDEPEQAKSGVSGHDSIAGGFHRSVQLPHVYLCAISQDGDYIAVATDSDGNTACNFPSEVVLDGNLACFGIECKIETVLIVELRVHNATGGRAETAWFEYLPLPCVTQTFFNNGTHAETGNSKTKSSWHGCLQRSGIE